MLYGFEFREMENEKLSTNCFSPIHVGIEREQRGAEHIRQSMVTQIVTRNIHLQFGNAAIRMSAGQTSTILIECFFQIYA